jgi:hypothetical protein
MSGESHRSQKTQLAAAIAQGTSPKKWASDNDVPKDTARLWAQEPTVRSQVASIRRRAVDRAVGRLTQRALGAAAGIVNLAEDAVSETVRLSALRATYSDLIAVSQFGALEDRMTALEVRAGFKEPAAVLSEA